MVPRQTLAIILSMFLAVPLWAKPELVGTVASSQSASAQGSDLLPGSTIFSGDTIAVREHGTARITLAGGSLVRLSENSELRLLRTTKAVQLRLNRGQMNLRSLPESPVEGLLGDGTFHPAGNSPAIGVISFRSPNTAVLFAQQGDWMISTAHDGNNVLLHEGTGMEAKLVEDSSLPAGYAQRPPTAAAGGGGVLLVLLLGALLIGGTLAAAFILGSNESGVSCQEEINAVSPFVPCRQ